MDQSKFDDLTRALAERPSRRRVLRGLAGGAAAMVGAALGRGPAVAAPMPKTCKVGCSGFNRQGKTACEKACKECGGDFDRVCTTEGPFGPTAFVCCARGHRMRLRRGGLLPRGDRALLRRPGQPHVLSRGDLLQLRRSAPARRSG